MVLGEILEYTWQVFEISVSKIVSDTNIVTNLIISFHSVLLYHVRYNASFWDMGFVLFYFFAIQVVFIERNKKDVRGEKRSRSSKEYTGFTREKCKKAKKVKTLASEFCVHRKTQALRASNKFRSGIKRRCTRGTYFIAERIRDYDNFDEENLKVSRIWWEFIGYKILEARGMKLKIKITKS